MVRHTGENLVDVVGVAVASVLSLQSPGVYSSEFDAPETDCFPGDDNPAFRQNIFDVSMAQVEAIVEPESLPHEVLWVQRRR